MNKVISFLLVLCLSVGLLQAKPKPFDEGMWLPLFLKELNYNDMKVKGLKLSAEDIYSVNRSSLKDGIVSFGGFCTGEMISPEGLLLTNHHCGYRSIQTHSSVEKNYLRDGFWAMSRQEEIPNAGLTATFIVRIEDVSKEILQGVPFDMEESQRQQLIQQNIEKKVKASTQGTHYGAIIRPFFYGAEYYMFVTETFRDVRLVGAPPSAIGNFGRDTDNWMWPRHTGDFSLFRIYAGPDGKPADYSPSNVPYKPKHYFPISLKGIKKDDFTMVMGFPGRTEQYLSSFAVKQLMEVTDPKRIAIRDQRLRILDAAMKSSDKTFIQYAATYASISNYHKKWTGELRGLKKLDALNKKRALEAQFAQWVAAGNAQRKQQYGNVLQDLQQIYEKEVSKYELPNIYWSEAVMAIDAMRNASVFHRLYISSNNNTANKAQLEKLREGVQEMYKNYDTPTDRKLFATCLQLYYKDIDKDFHPAFFKEIEQKYQGDFEKYADWVFGQSMMVSEAKTKAFVEAFKDSDLAKIAQDPVYIAYTQLLEIYTKQVQRQYQALQARIDLLQRTFVMGLREMQSNKKFYPDANSTLRITYGKVNDYLPRDAVQYQWQTFLDGVMEKEDPLNDEFIVPQKLKELYQKKDFGIYAEKGRMPVCFTASNHTTGGNSGSPILNAEGHLIGTNFDRNWEGTMSDIMYDPDQVRNISVDIRYTLFIIDKFAGAGHLVKEMKIIR